MNNENWKKWKIYFNALLDDKKFNNETFKEIAERLSLFYYKKGVLYEKNRTNKTEVKRA